MFTITLMLSLGLLLMVTLYELYVLHYNHAAVKSTVVVQLFHVGAVLESPLPVGGTVVYVYASLAMGCLLVGWLLGMGVALLQTYPSSLVAVFSCLYAVWVYYNNTGDRVAKV